MDEAGLLTRLHALLAASLPLWDVEAEVVLTAERIELRPAAGGVTINVAPAPAALQGIARWSVTRPDGGTRTCGSVIGVLDAVREGLGAKPSGGLPLRLGVMGLTS